MYTRKGKVYMEVVFHLNWNLAIHPVEVMLKNKRIYCRGTALKPSEWRELRRHDGDILPSGILKITGIPLELK